MRVRKDGFLAGQDGECPINFVMLNFNTLACSTCATVSKPCYMSHYYGAGLARSPG